MAFVYLLADWNKEKTYKIGVTAGKIEDRIKKLQTGNGGEIILCNSFETDFPFFIEKRLHLKFCKKRMVGEWFQLEDEEAMQFLYYCELYEKTAKSLDDSKLLNKKIK